MLRTPARERAHTACVRYFIPPNPYKKAEAPRRRLPRERFIKRVNERSFLVGGRQPAALDA